MPKRILSGSTNARDDLEFFMVDSTDHITGKTGLTVTVTIRKPGGSFASPAGAVSEIANGWYRVAANGTDNATPGALLLHATATGADPTDKEFLVVSHDNVSTATPTVNTTQFGGSNGTFSGGRPEVNTTHVAGTAQTAKDIGAINVTNLNTLSSHDPGETIMGATDLGTGSGFTSLASATNLAAAKTVVDAIKLKTDNLPASPAATGDAMTLTSAYDAAKTAADATTVASSFTSVLSKLLKYVQLMVRKDAAIATDNATELTAINANGGSGAGSFDNTTDAEQAIRDRGDAAWITATGFSTLDAAGVRTAVGLASANLDTQLAAKAEPGDAMALTADALDAASLAASAGTEIAAAVQTSAATTPLPSDVKKINATTITGTGVLGDEFGPA